MLYRNPSSRPRYVYNIMIYIYIYIVWVYTCTAINDLRTLVGSICFATGWKNNNIYIWAIYYICIYIYIYYVLTYIPSVYSKNNNNKKKNAHNAGQECLQPRGLSSGKITPSSRMLKKNYQFNTGA